MFYIFKKISNTHPSDIVEYVNFWLRVDETHSRSIYLTIFLYVLFVYIEINNFGKIDKIFVNSRAPFY